MLTLACLSAVTKSCLQRLALTICSCSTGVVMRKAFSIAHDWLKLEAKCSDYAHDAWTILLINMAKAACRAVRH